MRPPPSAVPYANADGHHELLPGPACLFGASGQDDWRFVVSNDWTFVDSNLTEWLNSVTLSAFLPGSNLAFAHVNWSVDCGELGLDYTLQPTITGPLGLPTQ